MSCCLFLSFEAEPGGSASVLELCVVSALSCSTSSAQCRTGPPNLSPLCLLFSAEERGCFSSPNANLCIQHHGCASAQPSPPGSHLKVTWSRLCGRALQASGRGQSRHRSRCPLMEFLVGYTHHGCVSVLISVQLTPAGSGALG